jgi:hypothetical protein
MGVDYDTGAYVGLGQDRNDRERWITAILNGAYAVDGDAGLEYVEAMFDEYGDDGLSYVASELAELDEQRSLQYQRAEDAMEAQQDEWADEYLAELDAEDDDAEDDDGGEVERTPDTHRNYEERLNQFHAAHPHLKIDPERLALHVYANDGNFDAAEVSYVQAEIASGRPLRATMDDAIGSIQVSVKQQAEAAGDADPEAEYQRAVDDREDRELIAEIDPEFDWLDQPIGS